MAIESEAVNFIKDIFQNDFSGHDYFHSLRVYRVAGIIAERKMRAGCGQTGCPWERWYGRAFAYGSGHNRAIYDPAIVPKRGMSKEEYQDHATTSINHFYEKLFLLKDMMNTDTGREKIAEKRKQFMSVCG